MQDLSPAAFEGRAAHNRALLAALDRPEWSAEEGLLSAQTTTYVALMKESVRDELEAYRLGCHLYPVNSIGYGGVHNNFLETLEWMEEGEMRGPNLIARLSGFPAQAKGYQELLLHGVKGKCVFESSHPNCAHHCTMAPCRRHLSI